MACATKPTRREKEMLEAAGKRPNSWLKKKDLGNRIEFVSRTGKSTICLAK